MLTGTYLKLMNICKGSCIKMVGSGILFIDQCNELITEYPPMQVYLQAIQVV